MVAVGSARPARPVMDLQVPRVRRRAEAPQSGQSLSVVISRVGYVGIAGAIQ